MPTTKPTTGAMWRLGLPVALMIAFGLVGLVTRWQDDGAVRAPIAAPVPPRVTSPPAGRSPDEPVAPAETATAEPEDPQVSVEVAVPPDPTRAEAPSEPVLRRPEDIAPLAPDVVVALEPWPSEPGALAVLAHTHLADGDAPGGTTTTAEALAPQAGDDFQGPEPGALYWFGPRGLVRIRILEEARR